MTPRTPPGLASGGRALWDDVVATGDLRPDLLRVLTDCCHEVDLIDDLQAALKGAPHTVLGSQRQPVINPLISELRMHRSTLSTLLRALALVDSDTSAEDAGRAASGAAMALARARWDKAGKR
jgi:hypothetical protein